MTNGSTQAWRKHEDWGQEIWLPSPSFVLTAWVLTLPGTSHESCERDSGTSILSPRLPCGFLLPQVLKVSLASLARMGPVGFQAHLESLVILVSQDYKDLQDLKVR